MILETFVNKNKKAYTKKSYFTRFKSSDLPYSSHLIPLSSAILSYSPNAKGAIYNSDELNIEFEEVQLFGQSFGDFKFSVQEPATFLGVHLKPTSVYKIFGRSLENLRQKSLGLASYNPRMYNKLKEIFEGFSGDLEQLDDTINDYFGQIDNSSLKYNIDCIDESIQIIEAKKGIVQVKDLMQELPFSQKTLEIKFRQIIGLTPGQFIRKTRFLNFLNDYYTSGYTAKELIYHYQFYDRSHFSKEVKYFTGQGPRQYFASEFSELKKCVNF